MMNARDDSAALIEAIETYETAQAEHDRLGDRFLTAEKAAECGIDGFDYPPDGAIEAAQERIYEAASVLARFRSPEDPPQLPPDWPPADGDSRPLLRCSALRIGSRFPWNRKPPAEALIGECSECHMPVWIMWIEVERAEAEGGRAEPVCTNCSSERAWASLMSL
jgi:hypothetical protein